MTTLESKKLALRMAAMHTVFGTGELLEMILILLPIKDLLLSMRVCKRWKNAQAYPKLQKALFMLPDFEDPGDCGFSFSSNSIL